MDEVKMFCKVAIQRTIKTNFVSLIAEQSILNVCKGRVLKTIRLETFKKMTFPYMVLITVTKKGMVLIDPVFGSDRHIEENGTRLDFVTDKKGARNVHNVLI
jgi:hypothetical protein